MNHSEPDFDVAVIGGGPAGSATAAYLAKAGAKCVVFESALFPRPHVGESLVPSSTKVFKDLDFLPQMEAAKFPHKYGAVWTTDDKKPNYVHDLDGMAPEYNVDIRFEERQQEGMEDRNYTYHVDRGKFDLLLLQHAQKLGSAVYDGVRVNKVDFDQPNPEVFFNLGAKQMSVNAKMVVDCSGRQTCLGNQLKLKVKDPVFDQFAYHAWFEDFDRTAFAKRETNLDYIYIHFLPISNTWIWQIPISDTVTSIGLVTQKKNFAKSKEDREKFFWQTLESRPLLAETLRKSKQVRPFKEEGDYSYAMKQLAGDKFMMVGDAGRFVDPIFSTGVSIALNSARFAHKDILAAIEKNDFSRSSFKTYEDTLRRGTKNWYEFISVYYRLNVLFTYFVEDKNYRLDVLKLLQGDVYDEETPEVLTKMKAMVTKVEQSEKHPWHKLLGDLTSNAFSPEALQTA